MASPIDEPTDEITRIRMEIVGLKLTVQALAHFVANAINAKQEALVLEHIKSAALHGVDNSNYKIKDTEDLWKREIRRNISDIIDPLIEQLK